ncbi:MAG TPA: NF038122 family metalloprotease, partial [Caulobacteraceae bacterium]|nr:NF038122 family metalloprotease [Caulobacteraceae bacterium]
MDIILEWDPSVASLPSSERAAFEAAVTYAADYWDYTILNPVTIDLSVGWGEITQDGQSTPIPSGESEGGPNDGYIYNYGQVVSALRSSATSAAGISAAANLSAIDPSGGTGIYISALHAEALGLPSYTDGAVAAGAVGFGAPDPGSPYNFSTTNRAIPGEADFVGIALHEISHALDRVSDAGSSEPPTIADLFRFTAPGVENPSAGLNSYFSVDGGNTPLEYWAGPSTDPGDWSTTSGPDSYIDDSFNDMYAVGVENPVTSVDLNLMSALGYAIAPPPDDDFTGQGLADITWRNTDGDTGLWLTNPGGGYTPVDIGSA